jgi:sulfur carrier protein
LSPEPGLAGFAGTGVARNLQWFRCEPAISDNGLMNIQLNGEPRTLPASATLLDLLAAEQLLQRRVAVEVNGEIVSRSRHAEHVLAEGDVVEIVHALGGG